MRATNPRPRKYANDAERQKAYRNRYAVLEMRLLPETAATLESIAIDLDVPKTELINSMINFALLNYQWRQGLFGKRLPTAVGRKADAQGFWIDHEFDKATRLYTVVVRDSQSVIVSKPQTFETRAQFAKLRPIDFEPIGD